MIVHRSLVSIQGGLVNTGGVRWSYYDIQTLRSAGATSLTPLNVIYEAHSATETLVALFGVNAGSLMDGDTDNISLPCPPYCGKNPRSFAQALSDLEG